MKIRLRFFASLRERLHESEAELVLPEAATVSDLWATVCAEHPELQELTSSISFAVNHEYVERKTVLADGDEVALIPPVSGGSPASATVRLPPFASSPFPASKGRQGGFE